MHCVVEQGLYVVDVAEHDPVDGHQARPTGDGHARSERAQKVQKTDERLRILSGSRTAAQAETSLPRRSRGHGDTAWIFV